MNFTDDGFELLTVEIPEIFKSHNTGHTIERCIICDCNLMEEGKNYLIEKAIKNYPGYQASDCVFEYAICFDCAQKMQQNISAESMKKMGEFFTSRINLEERMHKFYEQEKFDPNQWIENCLIEGTSQDECREFQIFGHFIGDKMLFSMFPYMIGTAALESLSSLMSKSTRDEMNGFIDDNLGGPPEFKELLKERPHILV